MFDNHPQRHKFKSIQEPKQVMVVLKPENKHKYRGNPGGLLQGDPKTEKPQQIGMESENRT